MQKLTQSQQWTKKSGFMNVEDSFTRTGVRCTLFNYRLYDRIYCRTYCFAQAVTCFQCNSNLYVRVGARKTRVYQQVERCSSMCPYSAINDSACFFLEFKFSKIPHHLQLRYESVKIEIQKENRAKVFIDSQIILT